VSTRNKKKSARKPKANAVKSRRRPHGSAALRPPAPPDRSEEPKPPIQREAERETRWAADDLSATWWDEVWPFRDEPREGSSVTDTPEETAALTDPGVPTDIEPDVESGEDATLKVPPPLVVPSAGRPQGLAWVCVLVATVLVAAGLVWWATSRGAEEQSIAIHDHPYAAPVRLVPNSSFVRSRVLPSGDVVVKHWIRIRRQVDAVNLKVPRVAGLASHALTVSDVVLVSNGLRLPASSPVDHVGITTYALLPTHRLYIRYRLSGVVQRSGGPGERALARITALGVTTSTPVVRTTLAVVGAQVLALACTPEGQSVATPCGNDSDGTWSTRLGPGQQASQVMAQLNLS
jgi:hypothetical protein